MALKSTIYKANLQIADIENSYYADHALTLARHPSETDERMMVRLVAMAYNAHKLQSVCNGDGTLAYSQVAMDVNGDGHLDNTAWAGAQDGVLVWDKNGDGEVRDASQYAFNQYGGQTDLQGLAAGFDSNADGVFDATDAKFAEFKVWQDADQDGVSDAGEVRSLAGWGLTEINMTSDGVVRTPAPGVKEAGQTTATATDGTSVLVGDVAFAYSNLAYSAHQGWINQQLQVISA